MTDIYSWLAIYQDDSQLEEHEALNFASVDQSRLKSIALIDEQGVVLFNVLIPEQAKGVFFRRRKREISLSGDNSVSDHPPIHCIGWKREESGSYLFVFQDGSALLTDNLQAV